MGITESLCFTCNSHIIVNQQYFKSEKAVAPRSRTLAWKIPWTEEPGRLQSMGSRRVRHNWATSLSLFTFMHWRRKWQPTPMFLPRESQGWGSLAGCCLWGHTSRTQLKWVSSSSSQIKIKQKLGPPTWAIYTIFSFLPLQRMSVPDGRAFWTDSYLCEEEKCVCIRVRIQALTGAPFHFTVGGGDVTHMHCRCSASRASVIFLLVGDCSLCRV